jgi:hypothetical protein
VGARASGRPLWRRGPERVVAAPARHCKRESKRRKFCAYRPFWRSRLERKSGRSQTRRLPSATENTEKNAEQLSSAPWAASRERELLRKVENHPEGELDGRMRAKADDVSWRSGSLREFEPNFVHLACLRRVST